MALLVARIFSSEHPVHETVRFAVMEQILGQHLSKSRHGSLVHLHFLEDRVVVLELKGQRKVKDNVGSVGRHVALDHRRLVRVDHDKGKRNRFLQTR